MKALQTALLAVALTAALAAPNFKLYLKDGSDHLVREYQVLPDRLRYYSVERGVWEEIPLELVDLARTVRERDRYAGERTKRLEEDRVEAKAEREARVELQNVPIDDGVYWANGAEVAALKQGETKVKRDKRRSILKVITPIPIVSGKATVELEGKQSAFVVNSASPEFYIRLEKVERFGICRLTPKKESRIVEDLTIVPVTKETIETQKEVEIFRQELAPSVYKIWPVQPLEPGEYAVVQFAPDKLNDKLNLQVWDFSYPGKKQEAGSKKQEEGGGRR